MNYDFSHCTLCPRKCGADRTKSAGVCGMGDKIKAARASLHMWEEPCISGQDGSGTVFFSGCTLKCCFCQNYEISHKGHGREISVSELSDIFLRLQENGAENINLVTATHFVPHIINALDHVRQKLKIPVVYNSSGYEIADTLKMLRGYIDIFLPDLKYFSPEISERYSKAADYFEYASEAVLEMHHQQPELVWDGDRLCRGLVVRHLILPRCRHDSIRLMKWLRENLPEDSFLISLMSQYTPAYRACDHPEINRRISTFEYRSVLEEIEKLGLDGYTQDRNSASEEYIPEFDLSGIQDKIKT
ncbi:MAG: radical SAM protein [Porcipelethomonas sp.]